MGAKLAHPDKLCINMWGDAAIGMTGMDFETAVRSQIPILSILFNNYAMAMEFKADGGVAREVPLHRHLRQLRGLGEGPRRLQRARRPSRTQIMHALKNGIAATKEGKPALLEFITTQDKVYSTFEVGYQG